MIDYQEYIQSAAWITRREQAKAASGGRCCLCSSTDDLHVHHDGAPSQDYVEITVAKVRDTISRAADIDWFRRAAAESRNDGAL